MIAVDTLYVFADDEVASGEIRRSFGIFASELLDGFVEAGVDKNLCLVVSDDAELFFAKRFPTYKRLVLKSALVSFLRWLSKGKKRHLGEFHKLGIYKKAVDKGGFEAIWFPVSMPGEVLDCQTPSVVTIHDLMLYHESKDEGYRTAFKNIAQKAQAIVAISTYVKQDIIDSFSVSGNKINVIPNAIRVNINNESKLNNLGKPYILDINGYAKHKNTLTLIKAFEKIMDQVDLDLVFCGGWKQTEYYNMLKKYIDDQNLEERVHLYLQIPEAERNYLLKHASLFVTPSTNEGFGRTPVEAAICGVPVISTKAASLYEATMGLVNYYEEPENVEELARKILECLDNNDKSRLGAIIKKLETSYAPKMCAQKYWQVFKK